MKLISRKEAKDKGLTRYFTGKLCPHGHIEERMVSNGYCIKCSKRSKQQYVKSNAEKVRQSRRSYVQQNPDKKSKWDKTYYEANKSKLLEKSRQRHLANPERKKEMSRQWKKQNADKVRMYNASRKKAIKQATPAWVTADDRFIVQEVYHAAVALEQCTGVKYHVDHIVPIKGQNVCGLNVWWNLRPLPAIENLCKSNSFKEV